MSNPYELERYARDTHADRVHRSQRMERVVASRRSSADRRPIRARRRVVTLLEALAALVRGKR